MKPEKKIEYVQPEMRNYHKTDAPFKITERTDVYYMLPKDAQRDIQEHPDRYVFKERGKIEAGVMLDRMVVAETMAKELQSYHDEVRGYFDAVVPGIIANSFFAVNDKGNVVEIMRYIDILRDYREMGREVLGNFFSPEKVAKIKDDFIKFALRFIKMTQDPGWNRRVLDIFGSNNLVLTRGGSG